MLPTSALEDLEQPYEIIIERMPDSDEWPPLRVTLLDETHPVGIVLVADGFDIGGSEWLHDDDFGSTVEMSIDFIRVQRGKGGPSLHVSLYPGELQSAPEIIWEDE